MAGGSSACAALLEDEDHQIPKLNDTQTILLSREARRQGRNLYPLPDTLCSAGSRAAAAILGLIKAGLAEERETKFDNEVGRTDGDISYGVLATSAGLTAIGIDAEERRGTCEGGDPQEVAGSAPRQTKAAAVLTLLKREAGASLPDLIAAAGWLPHTTRAALTGLRKKGRAIERFQSDEVTTYRIAGR